MKSKKPPTTPAEWHNSETDDVIEMINEGEQVSITSREIEEND